MRKIKFSLFFLAAAPLLLVECRTGTVKSSNNIKVPADFKMAEAKPLTSLGENYGAHFSPDGTRLIYISRQRLKHSHPQIYELNLRKNTEQRITYQDGEVADVNYDDSGQNIFYSSTTDEIKENPPLIQQVLQKIHASRAVPTMQKNTWDEILPPTEIYLSTLDGRTITRLTQSLGFDGDITVRKQKNEIAFVSARGHQLNLMSLHPPSNNAEKLSASARHDESPVFSPNGQKILFLRVLEDEKKASVLLAEASGKKPTTILSSSSILGDLAFSPSGEEFLFSSNQDDAANFEIYIAKIDGSCVRRLTYHSARDREPQLSPDGKILLFSSDRSGNRQIYTADFSPPPCPPVLPSIQSEAVKKE